jgi:hypothetical protein
MLALNATLQISHAICPKVYLPAEKEQGHGFPLIYGIYVRIYGVELEFKNNFPILLFKTAFN